MIKKGQSLMEYMLVMAAFIAVVIIALGPQGYITTAINKSLVTGISYSEC